MKYLLTVWLLGILVDYLSNSEKYLYKLNKKEYNKLILNHQNVDEEKIDNVDLSKPIIVAHFNNGKHLIIDGIHRVRRAEKENSQEILSYIVPFEVHAKFILTRNQFNIALDLYAIENEI